MAELEYEDRDEYRLVKLAGFLDGNTEESDNASHLLDSICEEIKSNYVFDLSLVEYINSTMLGMFVRFSSSAEEAGFQVLILKPPKSVQNVLELTGLYQVLPIISSEDEIKPILDESLGPKLNTGDIDYTALANEIESIISGESEPECKDDSQLGRILGK